MDTKSNSINWFEIPATDINRAKLFYDSIFEINMEMLDMGELKMAMFPSEIGSGKANGAIAEHEMYTPSENGVVLYLNANPDLENVLARVEKAGGKILMPKKSINDEVGFMALFIDSEGNKLALHSQK